MDEAVETKLALFRSLLVDLFLNFFSCHLSKIRKSTSPLKTKLKRTIHLWNLAVKIVSIAPHIKTNVHILGAN